jgi:hypothetical protein
MLVNIIGHFKTLNLMKIKQSHKIHQVLLYFLIRFSQISQAKHEWSVFFMHWIYSTYF